MVRYYLVSMEEKDARKTLVLTFPVKLLHTYFLE